MAHGTWHMPHGKWQMVNGESQWLGRWVVVGIRSVAQNNSSWASQRQRRRRRSRSRSRSASAVIQFTWAGNKLKFCFTCFDLYSVGKRFLAHFTLWRIREAEIGLWHWDCVSQPI